LIEPQTTKARTILVVDDEATLVATIKYNLEREGYRVVTAGDGESAVSTARECRPDLILLDLMMPGLNGLEVTRILRRETIVPILILTARESETDRVVGLEIGADDYVTKPFGMRELLARVHALLRRSAQGVPEAGSELRSGDLHIDLRRREVARNGRKLALKPKELDLLAFFVRHRGRAFTREELLDQVWGYSFAGDSRTVDVHVRWLREKIEQEPAKPSRLVTVRGVGYRFDQ
jgi:two-component system alkaline phosphatase synthesis response regulator PhoP